VDQKVSVLHGETIPQYWDIVLPFPNPGVNVQIPHRAVRGGRSTMNIIGATLDELEIHPFTERMTIQINTMMSEEWPFSLVLAQT
jgi:hypothetical protein